MSFSVVQPPAASCIIFNATHHLLYPAHTKVLDMAETEAVNIRPKRQYSHLPILSAADIFSTTPTIATSDNTVLPTAAQASRLIIAEKTLTTSDAKLQTAATKSSKLNSNESKPSFSTISRSAPTATTTIIITATSTSDNTINRKQRPNNLHNTVTETSAVQTSVNDDNEQQQQLLLPDSTAKHWQSDKLDVEALMVS